MCGVGVVRALNEDEMVLLLLVRVRLQLELFTERMLLGGWTRYRISQGARLRGLCILQVGCVVGH